MVGLNSKVSKTVALALGSGSARGYAHIGVIEVLQERGYDIVAVSGCSMGAVVGGFFCAGQLPQFKEWVTGLRYFDVLKLLDVSLLSSGAIRGDKIFNIIGDMLNGQLIEDLPIPFTAVATDISCRKEVWFQNGSLSQAVRASAAIPSLLSPVRLGTRIFVDGAVLNPVPISPCVSAHADVIIAVDLNTDAPIPSYAVAVEETQQNDKQAWYEGMVSLASQWLENKQGVREKVSENLGKLDILTEVLDTMQSSLAQFKVAAYPPDLLIRVPNDCCEMYEFYRAQEMIDLGRDIAHRALDAFEQGESSLYGQSYKGRMALKR